MWEARPNAMKRTGRGLLYVSKLRMIRVHVIVSILNMMDVVRLHPADLQADEDGRTRTLSSLKRICSH